MNAVSKTAIPTSVSTPKPLGGPKPERADRFDRFAQQYFTEVNLPGYDVKAVIANEHRRQQKRRNQLQKQRSRAAQQNAPPPTPPPVPVHFGAAPATSAPQNDRNKPDLPEIRFEL